MPPLVVDAAGSCVHPESALERFCTQRFVSMFVSSNKERCFLTATPTGARRVVWTAARRLSAGRRDWRHFAAWGFTPRARTHTMPATEAVAWMPPGYEPSPHMPLSLSYLHNGRRTNAEAQLPVTMLLGQAARGDQAAAEEIAPLVYRILRDVAIHCRCGQDRTVSLETCDLIDETYLKLFGSNTPKDWDSRQHFLSMSAKAMRSILVDHIRRKKSIKRNIMGRRVSLDDLAERYEQRARGLEELDRVLTMLAEYDPAASEIVELRFFGGFKVKVIADIAKVPLRTVERKLQVARAWLREEMTGES